jgi:hypothetical protein
MQILILSRAMLDEYDVDAGHYAFRPPGKKRSDDDAGIRVPDLGRTRRTHARHGLISYLDHRFSSTCRSYAAVALTYLQYNHRRTLSYRVPVPAVTRHFSCSPPMQCPVGDVYSATDGECPVMQGASETSLYENQVPSCRSGTCAWNASCTERDRSGPF